jgi:predicted NAD-dependent protein-ADP-ribosyltransferase YbiA (DUF1768 family)
MADRKGRDERLGAREQLIEEGKRAKVEHAEKHGDDSPTSAAATAEECAELGRQHGFGTYEADDALAEAVERATAPADAKAVERAPANKAQAAPEKK